MVESIRIHKRAYAAQSQHLISQLSIKKRWLQEQTLDRFHEATPSFRPLLRKIRRSFNVEDEKRRREKKKGKRSASFTRNRPLNFAHWVIVFSRARLRNSKERKRDVGINISLIFPREKIPGKTRLVRAEASMFSTSKMNEDGGRGGKKRRRKRRRRREKKRRKTG